MYYNPTEHLALEIIELCQGRVIIKQYIPKKHTSFGIKLASCVILRRQTTKEMETY
jgi:hypothetical protein